MTPARKEPDQSTYSGRFAKRLRKLREASGFTVEEVLAKLSKNGYKITGNAYYSWERARTQPPLDAYPQLAKALKVKPRELLPVR